MRIVVAAFGNELRRDDGFGIAVLRRLERLWAPEAATADAPARNVQFLEIGTGGIRLAQELLSPCDRLIVIDAIRRGADPGTVFVLEVTDVAPLREIDLHLAVPSRVLSLAKALGVMPAETFLVGCEPAEVDDLTFELSERVQASVEVAARHVLTLVDQGAGLKSRSPEPTTADPSARSW